MTTVIDPILQRTLRDNRGQRLHVLVVLLAASRPLMLNEISETLNISVRNLTDLMPRLAGDGYVYEINHRWSATDKARQLALPGLLSAPPQSEETSVSGLALIQARPAGAAALSTPVDNRSEKSSDRSVNFSDRGSVVVDQAFDQDSIERESTTTNSSGPTGKNFRSAADAQTLRAALTDAKVYGKRRRDLIADDWVTAARFTAWLDYADSLDALDNPAGFAILRCLDHIPPPEHETVEAEPPTPIVITPRPVALASTPIVVDPSVTQLIGNTHMTPLQVWQAAQGELQMQMTKAAYETWVKPTSLVSVNGTWQIAVPTQYAKEWWDTRLMTTLKRILHGIVGQQCEPEFVVYHRNEA